MTFDFFWDLIANYVDETLPRELYDEAGNIVGMAIQLISRLLACIYVYIILLLGAGQETKHFLTWKNHLETTKYPHGRIVMNDDV